ncbi:MAG TPA: hypothetical protein VGR06_18490 [Actinophytocola sp.]|jgi:hypothetical protein|uniref:hypothetical protein n=1 Tax=Actinophytocola sp. TaxID=1872138 RepID=UPI002E0690D6|nr:hypothetical protein [Actinophytocola sp.]
MSHPAPRKHARVHIGHHVRAPADYAHDSIAAVLREAPEPVRFACVRLIRHDGPVVAQAKLDLAGRAVQASATAATPCDAVDLLAERLRHRLAS